MKTTIKLKGLLNIQQTTIDKNKTIETVSARELWVYLESKQEFANWIKNRIADYDFKEMVDYLTVDKIIKREKGATTIKEYYISISMAKELGMVERNEKGKEIRKYFIDCESKLIDIKNELLLKAKARSEARLEYKPMTTALLETRASQGKETKQHHYTNEANLINLIVFGATSKKLKEQLEITDDESLRDNFTALQIKSIQDIQKHNTTMLEMGLCYDTRRLELNKIFNRKWAELILEEHIRLEA